MAFPTPKWTSGFTESQSPALATGLALEDGGAGLGEGHFMQKAVLGPLAWHAQPGVVDIEFIPGDAADLLPPLAREDQEAHDPTVIIFPARRPNPSEFFIREDPVASIVSVKWSG